MTQNPYEKLKANAFWRSGVAEPGLNNLAALHIPKFPLTKRQTILTLGSCFAQHIGRALQRNAFQWKDAEPVPGPEQTKREYGYGLFSFRVGNVYTFRMLRQWLSWALVDETLPEEIWEKNGRFFDPLRPNIEPEGFSKTSELVDARLVTKSAMKRAFAEADIFVFTLGLTECWVNAKSDFEYAACPGTIAGHFNPQDHHFVNQNYTMISEDLDFVIRLLKDINPDLKIILTVSPVPLTATASGQHVLVATTYSKSVLRAVAGDASQRWQHVDYFPSYEIVTAPAYEGRFFAANKRSVLEEGVSFVMKHFFKSYARRHQYVGPVPNIETATHFEPDQTADQDIVCEEEILAAFGPETAK